MRLAGSLLPLLTTRWLISLVGVALLALLVWLFGPLVAIAGTAVLEAERARLLVITVLALLWGAGNLLAAQRRRASGEAMVAALAEPSAASGRSIADAELAARFRDALARLKAHRFAKGRLYELPWYILVGPPGSGKTTALRQSGLRFPLDRARDLRGVGGTRNCDWFFTDEAVLIDTAGRWISQESDRAVDEGEWLAFLDLLRKHRPREPINGVVAALPVDDLVAPDGAARAGSAARSLRARLAELGDRLGLSPPVYLLLTKADLVAGFREMFADLDERGREQVWGFTLPLDEGRGSPPPERVGAEFDLLLDRLDARTLARLEAERDPDRRARIQAFALQVGALLPPLRQFLDEAFTATSYEQAPLLRGIYLTSGTQAGTPIDRLLAGLERSFGLRLGAGRALEGNRSFFLTRLLREVVFAEAPLVRRGSRIERRERRRALAAWATASLVVLVTLAGWAWSYLAQVGSVGIFAGTLRTYAAQAAAIAARPPGPFERDLRPALPALDAARAAAEPPPAAAPGFGLGQDHRLRGFGEDAYDRALQGLLLPRLLGSVETRLQAELASPEQAADTLKVYLGLGGQGELPAGLVAAWFADDWRRAYPLEEATRAALAAHLAALLDRLPAVTERPAIDGELVRGALAALDRLPLSKRAYRALLQRLDAEGAAFQPLRAAGPEAGALFAAGPGSPLTEPIPDLFTRDGFWQHFLPGVVPEVQAATAEYAALRPTAPALGVRERSRLVREMLELYYADAIDRWQRVERGLGIRLPASLADAGAVLRPLAVPPSPLARLLQALVAETRLTVAPEPPADADPATQALAQAQAAAASLVRQLLAGLGEELPPLGEPVEARFRPLAQAIAGEGGAPARLDLALQAANELYLALPPPSAQPTPAQSGQVRARAARLAEAAGDLPPPLGEPLTALAGRIEGAAVGQVLTRINDEYRAKVLPFCRQAIGDRFPFAAASPIDVALADLSRLLGAGGLFDQFTEQQLAPYVDTAQRPWRWQAAIGGANAALGPFELARRLRDGLFAGGSVPRAGFSLKPLDLDAGASRVVLDLDGQTVSYAHGPAQAVHMDWPAPAGSRLVRVTFVPVGGAPPRVLTREGAWGWFRLLQEARLARDGRPDLFTLTLANGRHAASFELQADSVENPYDLELLRQFRCPAGL